MLATILLSIGLFFFVYGALAYQGSILTKKASEPTGYKILRLREKSKEWFTGEKWEPAQEWYRYTGFTITLGEVVLLLGICIAAVEAGLILLGMTTNKAFFLVGILLPFAMVWAGIYYIQHKIDERKRILMADFIHCFSRLADFVHYKEVTDYEKIRRSMIGTRILHQSLPSEVYYRSDPKGSLQKMEKWVAFDEERLLLRNALQEALYSLPEEAEESLLSTVTNLRNRKAARWKKELQKVEFFSLIGPVTNVCVFALVMIVSMLSIIKQMMGW